MSAWDEVDERVLRWLLAQDSNPDWHGRAEDLILRPDTALEPQPAVDASLNSRQVDEALRRLEGYGLIKGERTETVSYAIWNQLRLTARGLIVLGEWPDFDRVAGVQGITAMLAQLARETADPSETKALRKTAGAIARLGEGIVDSTLESVGGQIAGP